MLNHDLVRLKTKVCSIDSEGNKDDTWLHEEMLDGDHTQAKRVSREWLRKQGWSDAEIALLMGK